jgi:hypothetical protein
MLGIAKTEHEKHFEQLGMDAVYADMLQYKSRYIIFPLERKYHHDTFFLHTSKRFSTYFKQDYVEYFKNNEFLVLKRKNSP